MQKIFMVRIIAAIILIMLLIIIINITYQNYLQTKEKKKNELKINYERKKNEQQIITKQQYQTQYKIQIKNKTEQLQREIQKYQGELYSIKNKNEDHQKQNIYLQNNIDNINKQYRQNEIEKQIKTDKLGTIQKQIQKQRNQLDKLNQLNQPQLQLQPQIDQQKIQEINGQIRSLQQSNQLLYEQISRMQMIKTKQRQTQIGSIIIKETNQEQIQQIQDKIQTFKNDVERNNQFIRKLQETITFLVK